MYKQLGLFLFPFLLTADTTPGNATPEPSPAAASVRLHINKRSARRKSQPSRNPVTGTIFSPSGLQLNRGRRAGESISAPGASRPGQTPGAPPAGLNSFDEALVLTTNVTLVGVADFNNDGTPDLMILNTGHLQFVAD